jgi:aminopeptidase C
MTDIPAMVLSKQKLSMRSWLMAILNLLRHDGGECSEHRVSHIEEVKLLRQGTANHSTV